MPPLSRWTVKHGKLHLQWKDKSVSRFPYAWLLDHQKTNWHPATNQKINPASMLSAEMLDNYHISHVAIDDNGVDLRIDWVGKPSIKVGIAEMKRHTTLSSRWGLPEKQPWKTLSTMPSSSASENTDAKTILHDLAVHGVHLVTNMPSTVSETEKFIRERLGPPRETFYGGMWDTAPRKENVNDTAYTYDALDPHTDTCYLVDSPGLQCFNCVAQDAGTGGKTRMVDSEMVVTILKASYPETFKYFAQTPLVFHHTEKGLFARVCAPAITLEHDLSSVKQFRYNEYDLAPLDYMSVKEIDAFYHHNNILVKVIKESEHSIKLQVGDMLLIDNHRVMHGRTAFKGYRNLVGCYVGADDWIMRARSLFASSPNHHIQKPHEQHGEQTIYESEWRHL